MSVDWKVINELEDSDICKAKDVKQKIDIATNNGDYSFLPEERTEDGLWITWRGNATEKYKPYSEFSNVKLVGFKGTKKSLWTLFLSS